MYKAMIVEDEMLVRIGIRNVIKWETLGIQLTEDAENGARALEIYRSEHPDIVLTDLRMPEMDGMSLIRYIRKQDKRCRFLILTCVEDFEQAQEAIAYSVSGYLLKLTMDFDEVEKMLQKAVEELSVLPGGPTYAGIANLSNVKERVLKDLLTIQGCYSQDAFREYTNTCQLHLKEENLIVGILSLTSSKEKLVQSSILNVLQEFLDGDINGEVFYDTESDYILLLNLPEASESRQRLLDFYSRISEIMKMYFGVHFSLNFSGFCNGYADLPNRYQEARRQSFFNPSSPFAQSEAEHLLLLKENIQRLACNPLLFALFDSPDRSEYLRQLEGISNTLPTQSQICGFYINLTRFSAYTVSHQRHIGKLEILEECVEQMQRRKFLQDFTNDHLEYLQLLWEQICEAGRYSPEIALAIAYIRKNCMEGLSLNQLADYVHLSPNYLSNLFKKEVGYRLSDYVNELRIEKAKYLLLNTRERSHEIASELGFSDPAYFCKVFKKYTGLSPAEYRHMHTNR